MAKHSKTLVLIASKLGLSDEDKVLGKAAELERLLQMKCTTNSNITDTAKVVICLDLASGFCGVEFDVKTAMKYSGLKSTVYLNSKKVIENRLELNSDTLTAATLCVSINCSGVQELAERILADYKRKTDIDLSLPQYVCMAVYQACRVNKVKVSKSKLQEKCRLKPAQWSKLDAEWTKFADEHYTVAKKSGRPAKAVANSHVETENKMETDVPAKKEDIEPQVETYVDWKRRVLENAYEQLRTEKKQNKQNKTVESPKKESKIDRYDEASVKETTRSPRRSPRKTPQKFEPYKSPAKKGVRLLFPINL